MNNRISQAEHEATDKAMLSLLLALTGGGLTTLGFIGAIVLRLHGG